VKPKWPTSVLDKLVPRLAIFLAQMYAFLVSHRPGSKTFLNTTEHSWTKTILSREGRRKLFNSSLMNKLITIELVSAIRLPPKLMDVTSSMSKRFFQKCLHRSCESRRRGTLFKMQFPEVALHSILVYDDV